MNKKDKLFFCNYSIFIYHISMYSLKELDNELLDNLDTEK